MMTLNGKATAWTVTAVLLASCPVIALSWSRLRTPEAKAEAKRTAESRPIVLEDWEARPEIVQGICENPRSSVELCACVRKWESEVHFQRGIAKAIRKIEPAIRSARCTEDDLSSYRDLRALLLETNIVLQDLQVKISIQSNGTGATVGGLSIPWGNIWADK